VKHYRVIILPSAERDITQAYLWLAERDEDAAIRWYNRLLEVILSLGTFPERCPPAPESRHFQTEIRQILHGHRQHKYRILFDIREDRVRILHVRHGARLALGESFPPET
jgi:plasmid stabilization system protein ParE